VSENRYHGIGLNGSVKNGIVAVFIRRLEHSAPMYIVTEASLQYLGGSPPVALASRRSGRASTAPVLDALPSAPVCARGSTPPAARRYSSAHMCVSYLPVTYIGHAESTHYVWNRY